VRIPEAAQLGRMHVQWRVGVSVVPAMVAGPPQYAILGCALGSHRKKELEYSRRAESTMGEIAVISGCDHDHAHVVDANRQGEAAPRPAAKNNATQRDEMNQAEQQHGGPDPAIRGLRQIRLYFTSDIE
jgi:hypothetical protein